MLTKDDPRLTAFVLGELPQEDVEHLQKAIAASPELQATVNEIRATVTQLENQFRNLPGWELPESSQPQAPSVERPLLRQPGPSQTRWAIAASVVALAGLGSVLAWQYLPGDNSVMLSDASAPQYLEPVESADVEEADSDRFNSIGEMTKRRSERETPTLPAYPGGAQPGALDTKPRPTTPTNPSLPAYPESPFDAPVSGPGLQQGQQQSQSGNSNQQGQGQQGQGQQGQGQQGQGQSGSAAGAGRAYRASERARTASAGGIVERNLSLPASAVEQFSVQDRPESLSRQAAPAMMSGSGAFGRGGVGGGGGGFGGGGFGAETDGLQAGLNDRRMAQPGQLPDSPYGVPGAARLDPDGDRFDVISDNPFKRVQEEPLSTFSIDVDTASYSKVRQSILEAHRLPRPDAVRIEEMVNYFHYDYQPPTDEHPFAARMEVTSCPWNAQHRLARVAIQGEKMLTDQRPTANLVFLLDTSGSMNQANKLPLVKEGMKMLLEQLTEKDRVAIVTYAGSAGVALPSTSAGDYRTIEAAIDRLNSSGSTNGAQGIGLAYQLARENFIADGVNRVILCTDGDFNVGVTGTDSLVKMVEEQAKSKVFLSVLGFGMGNLNDAMLEQISGRGNGNYAFIDTQREARKVLVEQASGTLVTIAKDVKIQVEFNPSQVAGYRLIGYENRILAKEDFNDDKVDAGEIGAGHQVTALYELIPPGIEDPALRPKVDELKYQTTEAKEPATVANDNPELLTVKLRYKQPDSDTSTLVEFPVIDTGESFDKASTDFRFAAAVAGFGMQLRRSPHRGNWNYQSVLEIAKASKGDDTHELRQEFVDMVQLAYQLNGEE